MSRRLLLGCLAACILGGPACAQAPAAAPPPAQDAWDLSRLYPDAGAWEAERVAIEAALPGIAALKGSLGASPQALREGLDRISDLRRRVQRLYAYAHLRADEDARVNENQDRLGKAAILQAKFDETVSFVDPEVQALGRAKVEAFEASEPGLARHRRPLELFLRRADHRLSPEIERLLAAAEPLRRQAGVIHSTLTFADMPWPEMEIDGKTVRLTPSAYGDVMENPDREVRRKAFEASTATLAAYQRTQGAILAAYLQGWSFEAKARGYPSSLALSLADDAMPEAGFRTLVAASDEALPIIHRYLRLRKRMLGVDQLQTYDLIAPLAPGGRTYSLAEGQALVLDALAPLGPDYVAALDKGFHERVMHSAPNPGKPPGAYTNDDDYGLPPYVLLSFTGNWFSVSTMAHEWGHAMHSRYAEAAQPFETAGYSPFVADAPSLTNEMLLADYLIAHARTRDEKIIALSNEIDLLRSSCFGPVTYAAFELKVHEAADKGEPLTSKVFAQTYCDLVRKFDGTAEGVMNVDERACASWQNLFFVYFDFYIYRYINATSAAAYFTEAVERGDVEVRGKFFEMLKSGGSDDPAVLLKRAGFDPSSPDAYRPMTRRLERLVEELEAEVAKGA
jgi:oligoendopeptidase F